MGGTADVAGGLVLSPSTMGVAAPQRRLDLLVSSASLCGGMPGRVCAVGYEKGFACVEHGVAGSEKPLPTIEGTWPETLSAGEGCVYK